MRTFGIDRVPAVLVDECEPRVKLRESLGIGRLGGVATRRPFETRIEVAATDDVVQRRAPSTERLASSSGESGNTVPSITTVNPPCANSIAAATTAPPSTRFW